MIYATLALKHWRVCLIGLLAFLLLMCLLKLQATSEHIKFLEQQYQNKLLVMQKDHEAYVANVDKMLIEARADEAQQRLTAEIKYNEEIKRINRDASVAHDRANSLSKQLTQANNRLKTARREAVEEYARTQTDVFSNCITEYRNMAKIADEYRADAERSK